MFPEHSRKPPSRHVLAALLALQLAGCASLQTQPPRQSDDPHAAITAFAVGTSLIVGVVVVVLVVKTNSGSSPDPTPPRTSPALERDEITMLGWNVVQRDRQTTWRRCTSRTFCTEERVTIDAADLLESEKVGRVVPVAMDGHPIGEVDLYVLRVRRGAPAQP